VAVAAGEAAIALVAGAGVAAIASAAAAGAVAIASAAAAASAAGSVAGASAADAERDDGGGTRARRHCEGPRGIGDVIGGRTGPNVSVESKNARAEPRSRGHDSRQTA
jgi:hypothetical protein